MFNRAATTLARHGATITRTSSTGAKAAGSSITSHQNFGVRFSSTTTTEYDIVPKSDFGEFKEYSVVFTNRSLNLMSQPFQKVMKDLDGLLKETYNADKTVIIPGSGTYGMEATARQFATDENVMVLRNGWFSFRWTEIFDMGGARHSIPTSHTVLKAQPLKGSENGKIQYTPYPIDEVVSKIKEERPAVLFAPHVETSTGIILPDDYIRKATEAMHEVGGLFVLDCIASGTVWADMKDLGVDVVISAPQKGWTGPACAALVMLSERAADVMVKKEETSYSVSLKRWSAIMDSYVGGGWGYHTTMPTDSIRDFHEVTVETMKFGMDNLKHAQIDLGKKTREMFESKGLVSVAAPGFEAPGVLVYHSPDGVENPLMAQRFKDNGLQIAMGVPWRIDEPEGLKTFRIGLFGLDKMGDIPNTVGTLEKALDGVLQASGHQSSQDAA